MMRRKPAAKKTAAKKPAAKKSGSNKMPPELLERFKKKSGAKKEERAEKRNARTEAKGERAGADKKKGGPKDAKMMGMKKGSGRMAKARAARGR